MRGFLIAAITIPLLLSPGASFAQEESFNVIWGQSYFEQAMDNAVSVFHFGDSLLVFGSHKRPDTTLTYDQMLLWLDLDGNILDTSITSTPPLKDYVQHAFLNPAGNLVMCGYMSYGYDTLPYSSAFIAELTVTAELVWWRTVEFPGATDTRLWQGCRRVDGTYFFVGEAWRISPYTSFKPFYTRCDSNGTVLMADTISLVVADRYSQRALSVAPTGDGGVVVGGYILGLMGRILKLNPENQVEWRRSVGQFGWSSTIRRIIELPDGDLLVGGDTRGLSDPSDLMMARLDSEGEERWFTVMPAEEREEGSSMIVLREGRFLIASEEGGACTGEDCITLATVEPNGIVHTFESINNGHYIIDAIGDMLQLPDCTVVAAGKGFWYHGTGGYHPGFYVARYSADRRDYGPPQPFALAWPENGDTVSLSPIFFRWMTAHDADPYDTVWYGVRFWNRFGEYSVDSLTDTTVSMTRQQFQTMGGDTFFWDVTASSSRPETTITSEGAFWFRLGPILNLDDSPTSPRDFTVSVYPNPFNATATITLTLPRSSPVRLSVFNTLGKRVREVDLGRLDVGEHRYVFEASGLPSGVYLARVEAAGRAEMRKVVLLK